MRWSTSPSARLSCPLDELAVLFDQYRVFQGRASDAVRFAASRVSAQESWCIPTKKELLTLREPHCHNPSFSLTVFPTEPAWSSDGMFWSSTPESKVGRALVSAIGTGDAWSETSPSKLHHVRLVRTAPATTP